MNLAISMQGVSKHYADFRLQDIALSLPAGQIMGLVGANGAGKSTILRILMGLIHADQGQVQVCGHAMPAAQAIAKREVGLASEDMRLYPKMTLRWHIDFVRQIFPSWDQSYADQLIQRFDLRLDQQLNGFSHGQRVKALLLLVLARRPTLLLLDEPTTGLDPVARAEVLEALADVLKEEHRSVLFSSHNTQDVEQLCDSISFLHKGKLIASADKESFLSEWRRVLCVGPWQEQLKNLPGVVSAKHNGSLIELKVRSFAEVLAAQLPEFGLVVNALEPMTLEDIFLTSVRFGIKE